MGFFTRIFGGGSAGTARLTGTEYKARFLDGKEAHQLIDVRTPEEFATGHIPGAVNINLKNLGRNMDRLPRDRPIVLYCRSGARSANAASMLRQAGFTDIYDLGGIISWAASGYPVKTK